MEVSQEKYSSLKELAEIQTQISQGLAKLKEIEETTAEYSVKRETDALELVQRVLAESREAIQEADKNKEVITQCLDTAKGIVKTIAEMFESIKTAYDEFDVLTQQGYDLLDRKILEVKNDREGIRARRLQLDGEVGAFEAEKGEFYKKKRVFDDRKAKFERNLIRIKSL